VLDMMPKTLSVVATPASAVHLGRFSNVDTLIKLLRNFGNFAITTIRCTVIPFIFYDYERQ
jgi:hypothetical protein